MKKQVVDNIAIYMRLSNEDEDKDNEYKPLDRLRKHNDKRRGYRADKRPEKRDDIRYADDDRHQQRRPHVQRKDELMGLVVRHKALEQFHLVTPCSVGPCVCLRGAPAAPSGR